MMAAQSAPAVPPIMTPKLESPPPPPPLGVGVGEDAGLDVTGGGAVTEGQNKYNMNTMGLTFNGALKSMHTHAVCF